MHRINSICCTVSIRAKRQQQLHCTLLLAVAGTAAATVAAAGCETIQTWQAVGTCVAAAVEGCCQAAQLHAGDMPLELAELWQELRKVWEQQGTSGLHNTAEITHRQRWKWTSVSEPVEAKEAHADVSHLPKYHDDSQSTYCYK